MTALRSPLVLASLGVALALGAGTGATTYALLADRATAVVREVAASATEPVAQSAALSIGELYERAAPSVVEIAVGGVGATLGEPQRGAVGSGFVFDREGHIVTNEHVVDGGGAISVLFSDGTRASAELVGSDRSTDLAVLDVDVPEEKLRPLTLADSSAVEVGDPVVALGSPFGLEGTITRGIVSALHRQMTAPNGFTINDAIQTDAAINHGNSGGPLLDDRGRVIGVAAQIESDSGGNDGVGFAIPSNTVRTIVRELVESGHVEHAYLGVGLVETDAGLAITEVRPGSPADRAGLRAATGASADGTPTGGDVIVAFDGTPVTTTAELQRAVDAKRPGDVVSLTVLRDGRRVQVRATLGVRDS
ncbi:MAG: hypothetical protein KatS3mg012_1705 [Gaiellaceae bacterium]|nr:MAG: hypothetical protein KatS3mg012_1705 [Gaiellaceae bacterium]